MSFTPFVLDNAWVVEFPTDAGGVLRLGPGRLRLAAAFGFRHRGDEGWYDVIETELRIPDAGGHVWQAKGTFMSDGLLYPIIDVARTEPGRWLRNAPQAWRNACDQRTMLGGISVTNDDRFYRYFWLDNSAFCWRFKYFGVQFALAALDEASLLVRISEVWCSWDPMPVLAADGTPLPVPPGRPPLSDEEEDEEIERLRDAGEIGHVDEMQPVAYVTEAGRLLFRNSAVDRGGDEEWGEQSPCRPLVFRRLDERGKRQRHVSFRAGARITAYPSPGGDEGFVRMGGEYDETTEYATDAGGRLVVDGGKGRYDVKLEKHPGCAGEPIDVLRARVRVTDATGTVWESVAHFTPEVFFEGLGQLESTSGPAIGEGAPPPGENAVIGIRALIDDGAWRCALTSDGLLAFRGLNQRPRIDVTPTEGGFGVRITGLEGRRRAVKVDHRNSLFVLDPEDGGLEPSAWEEDRPLPPLGYHIDFKEVAFRNTTFAVDDGFWHRNAVPIPVVFQRVGTGLPDPKVTFVADAV